MNKKLLSMLVILIVAAATISVVSATDAVNVNGKTISVNGVEFNIPDGYAYDQDSTNTILGNIGMNNGTSAVLAKGASNIIAICVLDNPGVNMTLSDLNQQNLPEKTINNKTGFIQTNSTGDFNLTSFEYLDGNKIIIVMATDENMLSSVIK